MRHDLAHVRQVAGRLRSYALSEHAGEPRPAAEKLTRWFRVENAAGSDKAATIFVYGDIGGWWGVDADQLVREVHALEVDELEVHINSYGGQMFDGFAIYAAIKNHPATVTTWVDGVAASAASVIAMAGDTIKVEAPGRIMIHDAATYASGNPRDLREVADLLDDFSASVAQIYADRAGGTAESFREAMIAETWYSSAAALEAGLADEIVGAVQTKRTAPESRGSQRVRAHARAMALGGVRE